MKRAENETTTTVRGLLRYILEFSSFKTSSFLLNNQAVSEVLTSNLRPKKVVKKQFRVDEKQKRVSLPAIRTNFQGQILPWGD